MSEWKFVFFETSDALPTGDEGQEGKDQEHHEQDLGDSGSGARNDAEAENRGNEGDNEKYDGIM